VSAVFEAHFRDSRSRGAEGRDLRFTVPSAEQQKGGRLFWVGPGGVVMWSWPWRHSVRRFKAGPAGPFAQANARKRDFPAFARQLVYLSCRTRVHRRRRQAVNEAISARPDLLSSSNISGLQRFALPSLAKLLSPPAAFRRRSMMPRENRRYHEERDEGAGQGPPADAAA